MGSPYVTYEVLRDELRLLEQRVVLRLGTISVACTGVIGRSSPCWPSCCADQGYE